ncbi:hypothetical protein [Chengkuizengella marina]|uniref:Uncharacterized protein n=1 Tax=Chengkuizengella marina TaxID=2507566 RepID=A0A6N9PYN5_9BACL|nr:hypothetical protein [Chengkuizengella marina]NBI28077.1 hypothetical protein [Chengkuizengella marina]
MNKLRKIILGSATALIILIVFATPKIQINSEGVKKPADYYPNLVNQFDIQTILIYIAIVSFITVFLFVLSKDR